MANEKEKGQDPAVLFYTKDFIVSTFTLTYEQKGKYITLLCLQHQKGKLTKNDLQSVLTKEDWEIADKFLLSDDGYYYNKRMADETYKRANFVDSRRSNGTNGGRPKGSIKTEKKPNGLPNGLPNDNLMAKLKETYDKPNENLPGNAIATVNVNLDAIKNADVDEYEYSDRSKGNTKGITERMLDVLIDADSDDLKYNRAVDDWKELGGINEISEIMGWDALQKNNWNEKVNTIYKIKTS